MTCGYCQFVVSEEDHRCPRCGRRLTGTATAAPAHLAKEHIRVAVRAMGANALAMRTAPERSTQAAESPASRMRAAEIPMDTAATLDSLPRAKLLRPAQGLLFGAELQSKIIPFETLPRTAVGARNGSAAAVAVALAPEAPVEGLKPAATHATRRATTSARANIDDAQATLDFLPPSRGTSRTLKTSAEAVIFCEARAASPVHRATSAALDLCMILIAFGSIWGIFQATAHPDHLSRNSLLLLGGMLGIIGLFYGALFSIAGTVTPGMRWTHLRLINFDGFPLDGRTRALRFFASWISILSGGIGILWALLDEENLTWHDHISKSFPTLRESESIIIRSAQR